MTVKILQLIINLKPKTLWKLQSSVHEYFVDKHVSIYDATNNHIRFYLNSYILFFDGIQSMIRISVPNLLLLWFNFRHL